jgi:outer membrane protein TolC
MWRMKMERDEDKARAAFRRTLGGAARELRALLADLENPVPSPMRDDLVDVLEHIEDILADETAQERDESVDEAVSEIDGSQV